MSLCSPFPSPRISSALSRYQEVKFRAEQEKRQSTLDELRIMKGALEEAWKEHLHLKELFGDEQTIFTEQTKEGETCTFDFVETYQSSLDFYASHNLSDLLKDLPAKFSLNKKARERIHEALKLGFDRAVLFPDHETLEKNFDLLLQETAIKPLDTTKFTKIKPKDNYPYPPYIQYDNIYDPSKRITKNRPSGRPYIFFYSSKPIAQETKDKKFWELEVEFAKQRLSGFTLEDYLLIQRMEYEKREIHTFDSLDDYPEQSNNGWLLDTVIPDPNPKKKGAPQGCANVNWIPRNHQMYVFWSDRSFSSPFLGARPAIVVTL
jgi:hypothetical protein